MTFKDEGIQINVSGAFVCFAATTGGFHADRILTSVSHMALPYETAAAPRCMLVNVRLFTVFQESVLGTFLH